jgi:hypothetical protein
LPGIDFSKLWVENITVNTKTTIWKYLKLVLMTSAGTSAMAEDVQAKIKSDVREFFKDKADPAAAPPPEAADGFEEHMKGLVDGKLGDLAKQIAEETVDKDGNMADLMANPQKMMELVQNVGGKIEENIKSGKLKESELIEEASAMLSKLNDIPAFEQILRQFTGGAKLDLNGIQAKMQQNAKSAHTKERLQKKLKKKREKKENTTPS